MIRWWAHLRAREFRFLAFVLANLVCVAGYLSSGLQMPTGETGGWRRINTQALTTRIEAGELTRREAAWYHPAEAED